MDKLFLLNPNFTDESIGKPDQLFFFPHNAMMEGILQYFPTLKDQLDITYLNFPRPRKPLIELLGEKHQGTPVLIIDRENVDLSNLNVQETNGRFFIHGTKSIVAHFSRVFGISIPHP